VLGGVRVHDGRCEATLSSLLTSIYGARQQECAHTVKLQLRSHEGGLGPARMQLAGINGVPLAGITVNVIAPGYISTGSQLPFEADAAAEGPTGRSGTPAEIAACVLFFAHESASFVTTRRWWPTVDTASPRRGHARSRDPGPGYDNTKSSQHYRDEVLRIRCRRMPYERRQILAGD
jgi:Enoyl-(Acyl carrier protein) reductase